MHVMLVISSLAPGGAERVITMLANRWVERGVRVSLVTLDSPGNDFYRTRPEVRRIGLGLLRPSGNVLMSACNLLRRMVGLRATVRELDPDVVVSFIDKTNILTVAATRWLRCGVVISERVDPRYYDAGPVLRLVRGIVYPWADAVVMQTENLRTWAEQHARNPDKVFVVPNPVDAPDCPARPQDAARDREDGMIMAMGRLDRQKGFDMLLQAFQRCAGEFPGWKLTILGEGHERPALERLVGSLGLAGRVSMPGRVPAPIPMLCAADIFVLSSRFEGFPNALLEAMAAGCPCISFDCPSGPADIIHHGEDGLLVSAGDLGGLAVALRRLMSDASERQRLGEAATGVRTRFSIDEVVSMWDNVLLRVAEKTPVPAAPGESTTQP